jgi:gamma-glutamylcyclotransferase (GGCT)/AIG2-like uncharacterized protein YtfP
VYGTLRQAFNHPMHELLGSHADFVGNGSLQGKLYDLGNFPGAVASKEPSDQVKGEIYALRDEERIFRTLDPYEGEAFRREKVFIRREDGKKIRSWIYLYDRPVSHLRIIPSGDYARFRESRGGAARSTSDTEVP